MNHVYAVALRSAGSCCRNSPWPAPSVWLSRSLRRCPERLSFHSLVGLQFKYSPPSTSCFLATPSSRKFFSSVTSNQLQQTPILRALGPLKKPQTEIERGLAFGDKPLDTHELYQIFGSSVPPQESANRLLRVLHGRRVDGTLDLPLPEDLQALTSDYKDAFDNGLYWLRDNYYVDEDEAIVARIEREESGYEERTPSQLRQRAQDLKLYGPQSGKIDEERRERNEPAVPQYYGPQSGKYQAKLSEKGDVFGESQIEKIRAQNEAKAKQEEEELEQQIEAIQARRISKAEEERTKAIAARPEQGIQSAADEDIRPPNGFEKWVLRAKNRASSKLTMESPEIKDKTTAGRLLPSFAFVVTFCTGAWLFSQHWQSPRRSERVWPNLSLSFATITGIISINAVIFVLWRFPPAWHILNKYCLVVPALPNPTSLFGNIFSHVQAKHLLFNMLPLVVFGPSLHEDLGRGNFLALYLASGVIGSFASLTHHTVRGIFYTSALGASGSIWAVTAAFFNVHSDNDFTIFFMPQEWKEQAYIKGWMLFSCLIAIDILGGIRGKPITVDYVAHAFGALTGWILAEWFKWTKAQTQINGEFVPKTKLPWWQMILQEGGNQDKGS